MRGTPKMIRKDVLTPQEVFNPREWVEELGVAGDHNEKIRRT